MGEISIYIHIMCCHVEDLVLRHGSLMKYCSQGAEAIHQRTKFAGLKRCRRHSKTAAKEIFKKVAPMQWLEQQDRPFKIPSKRKQWATRGNTRRTAEEWAAHDKMMQKVVRDYEARHPWDSPAPAEPPVEPIVVHWVATYEEWLAEQAGDSGERRDFGIDDDDESSDDEDCPAGDAEIPTPEETMQAAEEAVLRGRTETAVAEEAEAFVREEAAAAEAEERQLGHAAKRQRCNDYFFSGF